MVSITLGDGPSLVHSTNSDADEEGRSPVITMSKTSGVGEGLYGLVVGVSGP
jgi:hypothetical protein